MQRKVLLALITVAFLLSFVLVGCMGGVSQEQYDAIAAQLVKAKEQVAQLQDEKVNLQAEKEAVAAELQAAQAQITELQGQVGGLKEEYELVGATPAETAEKIVKYYHETHVYSQYDFFVCSDMASEVWNMLKAQGINAVIVVGDKDAAIGDILQSKHGWVLAEVAPGEYLALETTGGYVVPKSENALYYRGWFFGSPKELKDYQRLTEEYNVRVGIINQLSSAAQQAAEEQGKEVDCYNEMVDEYNAKYSGKPVSTESRILEVRLKAQGDMVDEKEDRYNQLMELIEAQEAEMKNIMSEINGLATEL